MAFSLEDFSPEQQEAISQVLADEQDFFPGLLPAPNTVGRGLAGLNDLTNKIPGINNFTDQFDYEPGGFSRFQERAQEQPLRDTAREVFDFANGRATDLSTAALALNPFAATVGAGARTATGLGSLGVKTTQALGRLAKSHPMISTLLGSAGLDYMLGDEEQAAAPEMQQAQSMPTANDGGRLQEVLNQKSTGRRDEIMAAIQSTGPNRQMISVGPDDDLGAMGIGKNYSKVAYTPARREVDAQKEMLIASKLQDEVIPKFEENARKITDNLRKVFAKDNSSLPKKKSATGKEDPISGPDFEEYIANEGRRLALLEVPGSFRKYIPTTRPGSMSAQASPDAAPAPEQQAEEDDGFGLKELAIGGGALAVAIAAARKGKLKPLQDLLTKGGKKGFEMGKVTAEAVKPDVTKLRAGNKAARSARAMRDQIENSTKQLPSPPSRLGLPAPDVNFSLGKGGETISKETVEVLRAAARQGKLKETLARLGLLGTKELPSP